MKFSGKIGDGTSNEPLNFSSDLWPWQRFTLSKCTLRAKVCTFRVLLVYDYYQKFLFLDSSVVPAARSIILLRRMSLQVKVA